MKVLPTPVSRFDGPADYPFKPHRATILAADVAGEG